MNDEFKTLRASIKGVAATFANSADSLPKELAVTRQFSTSVSEQIEALAEQLTPATAASDDRMLIFQALNQMQYSLGLLEARIVDLERKLD
ncbi:Uncharacterised protein [Corynebacterium minutissimum]|uniref:Uncharacterized protein n=1 Tax=Corynebacterium minutissimum TaxID=38301 RepID=A0A376CVV3_9CORY|nr:Uncharacterised protein [Corynebacterium minutissimum]